MNNSIITIENVKGYIGENNLIYLNLEDVARGLGFTQVKNGIEYVRWETVIKYCNEFSQQVGKDSFIPENIFYLLAMKGKNEVAKQFQLKVANEIGRPIGRNILFNILRDNNVLDKHNQPYQKYINQGYFEVKQTFNSFTEEPFYTTLVTSKGIDYIFKLLRKLGYGEYEY